jgi:hypothetical protein
LRFTVWSFLKARLLFVLDQFNGATSPRIEDGVMRLSAAQLAALIEGLDWVRVRAPRVPVPEPVQ